HLLARADSAADARHSRGIAAGLGAHHRDVRADLPHRWAGLADAGGRALLRGVRRRRARAAIGRRDGDHLYGADAGVAADRAALRQSDAAGEPRERADGHTLTARPAPASRTFRTQFFAHNIYSCSTHSRVQSII